MRPPGVAVSVCSCVLVSLVSFASLSGCTSLQAAYVAEGIAAGLAASDYSATRRIVFGGPGHDVYLGCLSCSVYASDSIFNENGMFGRYAANSILNPYSQYGSKYSPYGACNPYASDPPVVVDQNGNFYGRLTVNAYHSQALNNAQVLQWLVQVACK